MKHTYFWIWVFEFLNLIGYVCPLFTGDIGTSFRSAPWPDAVFWCVRVCFFLFHSIEIKTGAKEALREKKQSSSKQATFSKAPFFWERSYFFPQQVPFALFSSAKRQTLSTSFIFTFFLLLPQKNTVYTVNGIIHELSLKMKLSLFFCS